MLKRLLIAGLACLGLQSSQARAVLTPAETAQRSSILKNGGTHKEIQQDVFGRHDIGRGFMRGSGRTPYEFGISRECQQMRRKNKMRALGIRGSRI